MPHLQLESQRFGTIPLNDVFTTGKGVEARAGATGFGLPSVSVQWREGAGDGATFRSKRLLSRDIDVPIFVAGEDREGLKEAMRQLAMVLRDEVTLRFVEDDGTSWFVQAHRTGGGDFVYGKDTTGEDDLLTVLTFRAASPFWTFSEETTRKVENPTIGRGLLNGSLASMKVSNTDVIGDMKFDNLGDTDSYPVWKITGPGTNVQVIPEEGRGFSIPGQLLTDETITVDTETGRVTDQTGANRYAALAPAPRFWPIPPGRSGAVVSMDSPSPGGMGRTGASRKNHAPNPSFEVNVANVVPYNGWAGTDPVLARDTTKATGAGSASLKTTVPVGSTGYSNACFLVAGLTVGLTYTVSCDMQCQSSAPESPYLLIDQVVSRKLPIGGGWTRQSITFVARATTETIVLSLSDYRAATANAWSVWWDNFYVGLPGGYFDGDTPRVNNVREYEWDGTPDASTSHEYELGVLGISSIEVAYRPRKHMVI